MTQEISKEDYESVLGRVFVHKTSYRVCAYQVVGRTKCYVRAAQVPTVAEYTQPGGEGTHRIDWSKIEQPKGNDKEAPLFRLENTAEENEEPRYCIYKTKDNIYAHAAKKDSDRAYSTVEY